MWSTAAEEKSTLGALGQVAGDCFNFGVFRRFTSRLLYLPRRGLLFRKGAREEFELALFISDDDKAGRGAYLKAVGFGDFCFGFQEYQVFWGVVDCHGALDDRAADGFVQS